MRRIILILSTLCIIGCKKESLSDTDKVILINDVLNNKNFYLNISKIIRDSTPVLVANEVSNKQVLSNVRYHNAKVIISDIDSTNIESWKKDWLHPKFYISFVKITLTNNKVNIECQINSIGLDVRYVYESVNNKWELKDEQYLEIK